MGLVIERLVKKYSNCIKDAKGEIIDSYTISDYIQITIRKSGNEITYSIHEPFIGDKEINVIRVLYQDYSSSNKLDYDELLKFLDKEYPNLLPILMSSPRSIMYHLAKLKSGYGPLYPLIIDPEVEEIASSQEDCRVYIVHRRYSWYGWMPTNIVLDPEVVDHIVLALARKTGQHISLAHPIVEGLTLEGVRVALTFSREVSRKGSSFVLRKKPSTPWTITKLIDQGSISAQAAAYLWLILELRGSILIVGGMGTGKTSLLQALLTLIPPTKRVVTIEDTPEITATTGLWDPLVTRPNPSTNLYVDEYKLLKFALRRRADYIVVGEVRGREARLLVQASRLGHGTLATMHADDHRAALERLSSPPISIPRNLLDSIWAIVSMDPSGPSQGVRRIRDIIELGESAREYRKIIEYSSNEGFRPLGIEGIVSSSARLQSTVGYDVALDELTRRTTFLTKLVSRGIFNLEVLRRELIGFYSVEEVFESEELKAVSD